MAVTSGMPHPPNRRQGLEPFSISQKLFANCAFMAAQIVAHTLTALFSQVRIQIIKTGEPGFWHHEVTTGISHHPFNFTFVIPLAGTAKAILKQIMGYQL